MSVEEVSEKTAVVPYMDRDLPWGVTCREWESYLKKIVLRTYWQQRYKIIRKERGLDVHDASYAAMLELSPESEKVQEAEIALEDARINQDFVARAKEGFAMNLPMKANIEKEIDWIGSNANKPLPEVRDAPSYWAIGYIIAMREDETVRRNFWATALSKRLSPGDSRQKKAMLKDDSDDTADQESSLDDVMRHLGMTDGE